MGVSINWGIPKSWMVYNGKSWSGWFRGTPTLGNFHIWSVCATKIMELSHCPPSSGTQRPGVAPSWLGRWATSARRAHAPVPARRPGHPWQLGIIHCLSKRQVDILWESMISCQSFQFMFYHFHHQYHQNQNHYSQNYHRHRHHHHQHHHHHHHHKHQHQHQHQHHHHHHHQHEHQHQEQQEQEETRRNNKKQKETTRNNKKQQETTRNNKKQQQQQQTTTKTTATATKNKNNNIVIIIIVIIIVIITIIIRQSSIIDNQSIIIIYHHLSIYCLSIMIPKTMGNKNIFETTGLFVKGGGYCKFHHQSFR